MSLNYKTATDTSFVTGDSPAVVNLLAGLGSLAQHVVIFNDGTGEFAVEMSLDGVTYGDAHTVRTGEVFGIRGASISSIRVSWVSNSAYRVVYSNKMLTIAEVRTLTVPHLEISREHVMAQATDLLFGFNDNIGTAWEDVVPSGGDINWPTSAAVVGISSSDAADASAGAGVRQVEIHGLSATGTDQDEIVTMNGTTEVDTSLTYVRITKMHNENVGTYGGSHQGDITARVGSSGAKSGDTLGAMTGLEGSVDTSVQYGSGEMNSGQWSVPLGKVAYLVGGEVYINTTGAKTADIVMYEREGILNTSAPFDPRRALWSAIEVQGVIPIELLQFQKIKQLTDIWFRAKASNINTKIAVTLYFYVLDQNAEGA